MTHTSLGIVGASGRMGKALLEESVKQSDFNLKWAVDIIDMGKNLNEFGLSDMNVISIDDIEEVDVAISFTTPKAELDNINKIKSVCDRLVIGTTGFGDAEREFRDSLTDMKVVFSPNFSIGINMITNMLGMISSLPDSYDVSLIEMHHTGKKDAPSGTAKKFADVIKDIRGYDKEVYGRNGVSLRERNELEITALRIGGIPGIHEILIGGEKEIIRIGHTAFSRNVFAEGALFAAKWLMNQDKNGIYDMSDVLGLR